MYLPRQVCVCGTASGGVLALRHVLAWVTRRTPTAVGLLGECRECCHGGMWKWGLWAEVPAGRILHLSSGTVCVSTATRSRIPPGKDIRLAVLGLLNPATDPQLVSCTDVSVMLKTSHLHTSTPERSRLASIVISCANV